MGPLTQAVPLNKALDGARVLYRHFLQTRAPSEGWIREISVSGSYVRISKTTKTNDVGLWHRVADLRVVEVLQEAKAPASSRDDVPGYVHEEGE